MMHCTLIVSLASNRFSVGKFESRRKEKNDDCKMNIKFCILSEKVERLERKMKRKIESLCKYKYTYISIYSTRH